jgi:hypothetical protein
VTTLAPLPGRSTDPDDEGDGGAGGEHDVVTIPDDPPVPADPVVVVDRGGPAADTVDLTRRPGKPPTSDVAGQATWLFGLALALLTEGAAEDAVLTEVLAEAAGRSRAIEGAYGRAVALLSEFPGDPVVHHTVDLLAKALLRSRRPARAAEEA